MEPAAVWCILEQCLSIANKVHKFYEGWRDAPRGVKYLKSDVATARLTLQMFQDLIQHGQIRDAYRDPRLRDVMGGFTTALEQVQVLANRHGGQTLNTAVGRARFSINEDDIERHRKELQVQTSNLQSIQSAYQPGILSYGHTQDGNSPLVPNTSDPFGSLGLAQPTATCPPRPRPSAFSRRRNKTQSRMLIDVAATGAVERVKELITQGADVDHQSADDPPKHGGMAAIHVAVANRHLPMVETLVQNGAWVNLTIPRTDDTALHLAAMSGYTTMVQYLLRNGAIPDARNQSGTTPLILAKGFDDVQIALLDAGADPNVIGPDSDTPLHHAVQSGSVRVLNKLVACRARVGERNSREETALWAACSPRFDESKVVQMVGVFLRAHGSPNEAPRDQLMPLQIAVENRWPRLVQLLLEYNADTTVKIAKGLVLPIHVAAQDPSSKVLAQLLPYYKDVDVRDAQGYTALFHAIRNGSLTCVRDLIAVGASLRATCHGNLCPLHHAFELSKYAIAQVLIEAHNRLEIDIHQTGGVTHSILPIHLAASSDLVDLWVSAGGNIQWMDRDGASALHHAALRLNNDVVQELLAHGANALARNRLNQTPMELLCSSEGAWQTFSPGALNARAVRIYKTLAQLTPFNEDCRRALGNWRDDGLRRVFIDQLVPRNQRTWGEVAELAWNGVALPYW